MASKHALLCPLPRHEIAESEDEHDAEPKESCDDKNPQQWLAVADMHEIKNYQGSAGS
jgi:hypothetical protein